MTEKQLQDAVLELARLLGWLAYHTFDSRRSTAGFPDLVLVRAPRLLFVELKAANGRVAAAQQVWAEQLSRVAGAVAKLAEFEFTDPALVGYQLWTPAHWRDGTVERELRGR